MGISSHFPVLIVVTPLIGAYLIPVLALRKKKLCVLTAVSAMLMSCYMAVNIALRVLATGTIHYHVGNWQPPWGIEISIDYLGALMALMIAGVGLLIVIYSARYAEKGIEERNIGIYYALVMLLLAGLTGMVVTGDIFNLFVFLEIMSLSSYALVPIAGKKGEEGQFEASFRYLYMAAIASTFVLIGIGLLYMITGTLNMADLAIRLKTARLIYPTIVAGALGFLVVGFSLKAALFPLHIWMPDAYTHAPAPVNALSSGIKIEVCAYVLIRLFYSIFGISFVSLTHIDTILALLAATAIIMGSLFAIAQNDVMRLLAYSSVSQIGYIILGATLITESGLTGGIFHLINHSVMKTAMFLAAGAVIYKTGIRDIRDYGGLGRKMPLTMGAFSVAALAMVGIPPLAGFMSKWFLVLGSLEAGNLAFVFVILASSLLNAVYFFRVINHIYFGHIEEGIKVDEAPISMLVPTIILALASIAFGIFASRPLSMIRPAVRLLGL
ncbi:MAG: monovalent cation/H+ antiporter subunit D family protein [Candidatus Hydrothermarchaeales archaeon]